MPSQTKLEPFKIVRLIGDSQFLFATFVSLLLYSCQICTQCCQRKEEMVTRMSYVDKVGLL